ncbi:MAG: vanadium-dependent haloperoxidase [Solirubrobacteraceae bacterium]
MVLAAAIATTTTTAAASGPRGDAERHAGAPDVVLEWYDATSAAVTAAAFPTQVTGSRTWAIAWTAADQALARLRRAAPRDAGARTRSIASDAAIATAVHDALVAAVPAAAGDVDARLEETLARLPDGRAKASGRAVGTATAARLTAERTGDGLDPASVNAPFSPPPPTPGIWRPTPPAFAPAVQSGQGRARPFLVADVAQRIQPPPPPALDSPQYLRDLDEVRRLGGASSAERTPEQTAVALFWESAPLPAFTSVLRGVVDDGRRGAAARIRLISIFHRATVDAQIAVYAAKYRDLRWRPVTALHESGDLDFTPFFTTPAHPEYPSGHGGYAGAAEVVLRALAGPKPAHPITVTSTTAPGAPRTYTDWATLTRENVDGRVWEGIHLRTSDEVGVALGGQVARAALRTAARD